MIFLLISALIGVVSLQYFSLNYSIQGLNRAIVCTPIELMYKCVAVYGESPVFNTDDFETIVLEYYSHILPRYTNDYNVDFYYYNLADESMCLLDVCGGVEITIDCKLNMTYQYHRVMYYELSEANNG